MSSRCEGDSKNELPFGMRWCFPFPRVFSHCAVFRSPRPVVTKVFIRLFFCEAGVLSVSSQEYQGDRLASETLLFFPHSLPVVPEASPLFLPARPLDSCG